jgi:hypothetical protein
MSAEFAKGLMFCCALAVSAVPGLTAAQATGKPAAKTAEPLGRLFFTPEQRASLDVARTQRARRGVSSDGSEETVAPAAQSITYGGVVRRSDGKSTVWINGRPVNDNDPAGGAAVVGRVRPDGGVSLQVPQSGRSIELKPGQSVELLSGTIEEAFSRKPEPPEPKPAVKPGPGAKPERGVDNRTRGEQEQRRAEEAVSRTLHEAAKPGTAASSTPVERPR